MRETGETRHLIANKNCARSEHGIVSQPVHEGSFQWYTPRQRQCLNCATLSDMRRKRRDFMKCGAFSVLGLAGERALESCSLWPNQPTLAGLNDRSIETDFSVIGLYGSWAASLNHDRLPSFSFRNKRFADI